MPSPELRGWTALRILSAKEIRVLLESRAMWLMLVVTSVLTGHGFLDAIRFYGEASGSGGGPAALAQSLSPLDGIVVPTFGALNLIATLVFPFVVIRLFAIERESGELALSLQSPAPFWTVAAAKAIALYLLWIVALLPAMLGLVIWAANGGHLDFAETFSVVAGHLVRGLLTIGVGAAACSVTASASSAAIIALTFTLGTWMLDYAAAANGGLVAIVANYTPEAALRTFEHGELRIATASVLKVVALLGVILWGISVQTGQRARWRARAAAIAVVATAMACAILSTIPSSWDLSEDRRNSFNPAETRILSGIAHPLTVRVYLAAEDPRLQDLEHGVLHKVRRTVRLVDVQYQARSRSGLFEAAGSHYGEIWLELGDRKVVTRSVAEPVVLESLHELLGIAPPVVDAGTYPGYPLVVDAPVAAWLFFLLIPLALAIAWWRMHVRPAGLSTIRMS